MQKTEIVQYLQGLRDQIIASFESLEPQKRFVREEWPYQKGSGGGQMSVLRGDTFEKAAVNWSGVEGKSFPGSTEKKPFFATGVSLITHMMNPKAPTVHFNIRYIEHGDQWWLGGGYDLTPMGFENKADTEYFHQMAEKALNPHGAELYPTMKAAAKEYFTIKHYGEERGVGGIFFDHYNTGHRAKDFAMWKSVGDHFLESIMPIYHKRVDENYTEDDRKTQLRFRARYVEFNLLYDRGTKFGFQSGGNPKAILCSMPPLASW